MQCLVNNSVSLSIFFIPFLESERETFRGISLKPVSHTNIYKLRYFLVKNEKLKMPHIFEIEHRIQGLTPKEIYDVPSTYGVLYEA